MNKTLMGASVVALSSAQVSVAQAAEWDLDWGGFIATDFVYTDQDSTPDTSGFDVLTNAEIIFTPSITLDSGLTFGVRIEFEADNDSSPAGPVEGNTDEAWAFVKGSFGEIRAGAEDSPFGTMTTGAPSYKAGITSGTFTGTYLDEGLRFAGNADSISGDAQKVIYYTPRFSGFQVGVSYAHGTSADDRDIEEEQNVFSFGANYSQDFGAGSVTLSGTYETAEDADDRFSLGASFGFSGVTIGGGYAQVDNQYDFWNLGIGYESGPWGVALSGSLSDFDDSDEVTKFSLNGKYDLGPGVSARAFIAYGEQDGNGAPLTIVDPVLGVIANPGLTTEDEGFAIGTGINLSF